MYKELCDSANRKNWLGWLALFDGGFTIDLFVTIAAVVLSSLSWHNCRCPLVDEGQLDQLQNRLVHTRRTIRSEISTQASYSSTVKGTPRINRCCKGIDVWSLPGEKELKYKENRGNGEGAKEAIIFFPFFFEVFHFAASLARHVSSGSTQRAWWLDHVAQKPE